MRNNLACFFLFFCLLLFGLSYCKKFFAFRLIIGFGFGLFCCILLLGLLILSLCCRKKSLTLCLVLSFSFNLFDLFLLFCIMSIRILYFFCLCSRQSISFFSLLFSLSCFLRSLRIFNSLLFSRRYCKKIFAFSLFLSLAFRLLKLFKLLRSIALSSYLFCIIIYLCNKRCIFL